MTTDPLVWGAAAALAATVLFTLCLLARAMWRRHLHRLGVEYATGHLQLRRRLGVLTIKDRSVTEAVVQAETMYGWVWIRETGRAPHPGERPAQAHDEQIGWAPTRRLANRALARAPHRTTADGTARR